LIRNSSPQADAVVRDDIVRALAVTEDAKFLRGEGTDKAPKGLRHWAASGNVFNAGAAGAAQVTSDLGELMLKLMNNDVAAGNWGWIFAPRTWKYLTTLLDSNANFIFRAEMVENNTLWGFPFSVTTSVPITLTEGSNSDTSEIYLANFDDIIIGDNLNLSIDVSQDAAYYDGSNVIASFSQDQTVIRAISEHDLAARHQESIAVAKAVRWGA